MAGKKIVNKLEDRRCKVKCPFLVPAIGNVVIAWVVCKHESIESPIPELLNDPALLEACGFDILKIHSYQL